ncbi:MAG: family 43 glycosylhydrolase, partial [Parasporobacterium sp.]|nr:family 43 glycosylhydrolase [Parasporobacterium sp.]
YVSCYRSKDLYEWEFRNNVLHAESRAEGIRQRTDLRLKNQDGTKINIERPKILYCEQTGRYVMWMHYENGHDYLDARIAIASCDTSDGDFIYHGSFNPYGYMSRDCTLFRDDDGSCYFISASRDNADLHIYLLTEDLMNVRKHVNTLFQGEYREAPAMFRKGGKYYLLSSWCTGWAPNQGKWSAADRIDGLFTELRDFGDATTFKSQPAFVFTLDADGKTRYIYFGDRWCYREKGIPADDTRTAMDYYRESSFVLLPILFDGERPYIEWCDTLAL